MDSNKEEIIEEIIEDVIDVGQDTVVEETTSTDGNDKTQRPKKKTSKNKKKSEKAKLRKRLRREERIMAFALIIGGIMVVVALIVLLKMYFDYSKARNIYDDATTTYVSFAKLDYESPVQEDFDNSNPGEVPWYEMIDVDLTNIMSTYPEVIGWIWFEDDRICYPIMYSGDNDKYLHTAYNNTYSAGGAIFLDAACVKDFSSPYSILYGHNMRDESMFGGLKRYKNSSFYEGHEYFQIILPGVVYRYKIFAYQDVPDTSSLYQIPGGRGDSFISQVQTILAGSYLHTDDEVYDQSYVLNLSTCSSERMRFFVSAMQVDVHYR